MEKIYTLIQPSKKAGAKVYFRNVTTKISEISEDFLPSLSFDFMVEYIDGGTEVTSDIETFKRMVLRDDWWAASNDNHFVKKCEEYTKKHDTAELPTENKVINSLDMDKPAKRDHVNPAHYQGYLRTENDCLQWLETMQYLSRYKDPKVFKGAVELQARKYLDRLGGKDEESQEIMKAVWYLRFLAAYVKNGGPIRVADIDSILSGTYASSNGS
jgi:hypothetical protein